MPKHEMNYSILNFTGKVFLKKEKVCF
jgi:hypothetical protein